jgi:fumarate reductase subunit C
MREIIGWGSALVLLPTFGLQAYKQWANRHEHATASTLWFFILALVGVTGQVVYSWMLGNWVYFVLNACLVVTNTLGLALAIHRWWIKSAPSSPQGPVTPGSEMMRDETLRTSQAR